MTRASPIIEFDNVGKRFGRVTAVSNVSLTIEEGEFFALLGPSGCGKTTLLRLLAGFETPSEGRILIDGSDVSRIPPNRRPINMVFQSYAVFPHMTVAENVAYGLKVEGVAAKERDRRVKDALELVKLEGLDDRRPEQMSGGQRQRIALARALVKRPRVLLLDEPLSALDAKLRDQMRSELARLQEKVGITFLFVTHDQDEALALATRCAVMADGRLQQVATPTDLYDRPNSRFVADFIGSVNLFEGRLSLDGQDYAVVRISDLTSPVFVDRAVALDVESVVWVALRPEKITLHKRASDAPPPPPDDAPDNHNVAGGVIRHIAYLGSQSIYDVELESGRMIKALRSNLSHRDQEDFTCNETVWLAWRACSPTVLPS